MPIWTLLWHVKSVVNTDWRCCTVLLNSGHITLGWDWSSLIFVIRRKQMLTLTFIPFYRLMKYCCRRPITINRLKLIPYKRLPKPSIGRFGERDTFEACVKLKHVKDNMLVNRYFIIWSVLEHLHLLGQSTCLIAKILKLLNCSNRIGFHEILVESFWSAGKFQIVSSFPPGPLPSAQLLYYMLCHK